MGSTGNLRNLTFDIGNVFINVTVTKEEMTTTPNVFPNDKSDSDFVTIVIVSHPDSCIFDVPFISDRLVFLCNNCEWETMQHVGFGTIIHPGLDSTLGHFKHTIHIHIWLQPQLT